MAWPVFSRHGLHPQGQSKQSLTVNRYVHLFEDHLQQFMDVVFPNDGGVFMDENEHVTGRDHLQQFMDIMHRNNGGIFMDENEPCHQTTVVHN